MKRRFKRIALMMDFVTDGNKNIVSFVCLFIVCLLGMIFFNMQFDSIAYDIQHQFIINNSFILNNLLRVYSPFAGVLVSIIQWALPTQKNNNKLSKIFEILPAKKGEIFLERVINLLLVSISIFVLYFSLYAIDINNFYGMGIRGMLCIIMILIFIYLTFINITRFFRNEKAYKRVKIIGFILLLLIYLIPALFTLINYEDEINNIVNIIHGSSFVQALGDKSVGIIVGAVLFSIYFIFNYWYVKRQVYKD